MTIPAPRRRCALRLSPSVIREGLSNRGRSHAGGTGLEAAFVRFDNLGNSPWANLKVGKFELDNLLSEKRITWLSANGGFPRIS